MTIYEREIESQEGRRRGGERIEGANRIRIVERYGKEMKLRPGVINVRKRCGFGGREMGQLLHRLVLQCAFAIAAFVRNLYSVLRDKI